MHIVSISIAICGVYVYKYLIYLLNIHVSRVVDVEF